MSEEYNEEVKHVVISGAGIVGLVLALALKKHVNMKVEIYDKASAFQENVGAGLCMFPNGLRVIRDISPELLEKIRNCGYPLLRRRFENHDGNGMIEADENALHRNNSEDLYSIGLCRWRLQNVLYDAVIEQGIKVHFKKKAASVERLDHCMRMNFVDGTHCCTRILFGVDGSKSTIRRMLFKEHFELNYTGVTCIMGIAKNFPVEKGISFPSSNTTKCHACFFPTQKNEQCFQFYFQVPIAIASNQNDGDWHVLTDKMSKYECERLANRLRHDGWHKKYLAPLQHVEKALRVGFSKLKPHLKKIVFTTHSENSFAVLVGDAAHPPVPYTGQGAQLGIEDAGVIALLLKQIYPNIASENTTETFQPNKFQDAMEIYEKMRPSRTKDILEQAHAMGAMQQKRATNERYNVMKDEALAKNFFLRKLMPIYDDATKYNYSDEVQLALRNENASNEE